MCRAALYAFGAEQWPVDQVSAIKLTNGSDAQVYWPQNLSLTLTQGHGDSPKAGPSGASEAARAKPGVRTGGLIRIP